MPSIDTDAVSIRLRERAVRPEERALLISRIEGSDQADDLTEPPNCGGYGRIRHFRSATPRPWPDNPLPMVPAAERLGRAVEEVRDAQVFQNAACNWRCWYCFVPFSLLAANEERSGWLKAEDLVALHAAEPGRSLVIDCSGGQPDLVPEWIPWMMEALRDAGLSDETYLWSDDNLSNDYFWRYLSSVQRKLMGSYRNYGRVCCFKGFDAESFAFNTKADPLLFDRQFELFGRLLETGMDLYCYATFTSTDSASVARRMGSFMDRLMELRRTLPLRLVPLRVEGYGVVLPRIGPAQQTALAIQEEAVMAWNDELSRRFTDEERQVPIVSVSLSD